MGWGEITLYFYVPMFPWKDFFDGKDWENTKNTRRKGTDTGKFKRTRRKEWRKEKEEIFYIRGGSHTVFLVSCFDL
jgi:hypothetical protein